MLEMRMGILFLLILRVKDLFLELCQIHCRLNAVRTFVDVVLMVLAITPRSEKRAKILRDEWAAAQKIGVDFSNVQFEVA